MDERNSVSRGYARYVLGMCFLLTALNVENYAHVILAPRQIVTAALISSPNAKM